MLAVIGNNCLKVRGFYWHLYAAEPANYFDLVYNDDNTCGVCDSSATAIVL